jgi:hypothetical protein
LSCKQHTTLMRQECVATFANSLPTVSKDDCGYFEDCSWLLREVSRRQLLSSPSCREPLLAIRFGY